MSASISYAFIAKSSLYRFKCASPKYFNIQPMQIDTRNRDPKYINSSIFKAGLLPNRSAAPSNASYSGLLECPCTTRINKTIRRY